MQSERKLEFINADYLARGSIFCDEEGEILGGGEEERKENSEATDVLYLFFQITVTP